MGKVYESLKEAVKLQRSRNDSIVLSGVKHAPVPSLDEELNELAQRISGLKLTVKRREEEIKKETQQVMQTLSEDFTLLETKFKDAEETARRNESVSRQMEEKLTAEIHALQSELNTKNEVLQSRDNEINDLKSNVDLLLKQAKESETAIDQARAEAATEAKRVEQLTESFNTKIAGLEAQIREINEIIRGKEAIVQTLEQKLAAEIKNFENQLSAKEQLLAARDGEINDLKSKLQGLTRKIQEMSSFLRQAEALALLAAQTSGTAAASDPGKDKPVDSSFKTTVAPPASNESTDDTRQTVSLDFFDLMSQELAMITGPQASMIVRQHIAALGESIEKFPKSRLAELLDILSEEIVNEPLRISFRKWFVKQRI